MTSAIDTTKPAEGNATTSSVRANFTAAKSEIETLQADLTAAVAALEAADDAETAARLAQFTSNLEMHSFTSGPTSKIRNNEDGPATPDALSMFDIVGDDTAYNGICFEGLNAAGLYIFRRRNGTYASPTAILNNDYLGGMQFGGYHSGGAYNRAGTWFSAYAAANWTGTNNATALRFYVTLAGGITAQNIVSFEASGTVTLGGSGGAQNFQVDQVIGATRRLIAIGSTGSTNPKIGASAGCMEITSLINPLKATTAGAPAYVKGAIYFDTTLNKLRIGGATAWETITSV